MPGHSHSGFSGRVQKSWFHQLWQVVQVLSFKAAPDRHTITTMFDCWYDVIFIKCCVGFTPDLTGHTFQKVKLLLHQSTVYLPKSLGDNQDIFWQM